MSFFNSNYWFYMLPAMLLMLLAQWYMTSAYRKWSQVPASCGLTGAQAVQRLLYSGTLPSLSIQAVAGNLTDHYDPRSKTLNLSAGVYQGNSVAALAVAAHELGHAQQDHEGYFPLRLRAMLVPVVNIGSYLGWILIFAGLLLNLLQLAWMGVAVFSIGLFFALVTLPVELNASARARQMLTDAGLINDAEELGGVNRVLTAAALTYVASIITAALQVLYYISMLSGRRRR
jgi:hypothetical protein